MEIDTLPIACGADDLMHAAQYLAGVGKSNYSDPAVWDSRDAAIVILRDRYEDLKGMLDYLYLDMLRPTRRY